jgi:hypothetical protein
MASRANVRADDGLGADYLKCALIGRNKLMSDVFRPGNAAGGG